MSLERVRGALADSDRASTTRGDADVIDEVGERGSRLALVVDDDVQMRDLVAEILTPAGFRTLGAPDGEEALALALEHRPTIIIMDVGLHR